MNRNHSLHALTATAVGMAHVRAQESRRPDALFVDPYAQAFVAAAADALPAVPAVPALQHAAATEGQLPPLGARFAVHAVVRTRFFDDHLTAACAAGCSQIVLLAAGLDTRAFRLGWPRDTRVFELDLPEIFRLKERVLRAQHASARCDRVVVPVDLRSDWRRPLNAVGFDRATRSAWLIEGLLIYLTADEAADLLTAIATMSSPTSRLACEDGTIADDASLARARSIPAMRQFTSLWKGGLGTRTAEWLTHHGWQTTTTALAAIAASYSRRVPATATGGFLTAEYTPERAS